MDKKSAAWLSQELPVLVDKGIISAECAEQIKAYYQLPRPAEENRRAVIFALLGATLVGLGIILLIGHNWSTFTPLVRLLWSMGLLVAAQVVAGYAFYQKPHSLAWREGSSILLFLAIGASISLIGQTYHLTDAMDNFILVWLLLTLPIAYIMQVAAPAMFYVGGVPLWLTMLAVHGVERYYGLVLLALAVPYYWLLYRQNPQQNRLVLLSWSFAISGPLVFFLTFEQVLQSLSPLIFVAVFAVMYQLGAAFYASPAAVRKPWRSVGALGVFVGSFMLTFSFAWQDKLWIWQKVSHGEICLAAGLLVVWLAGAIRHWRVGRQDGIVWAPIAAAGGYLLLLAQSPSWWPVLMMNGYVACTALAAIALGIKQNHLAGMNQGMGMLALLIAARFLDGDFSFITRGIVFVVLGLTFLAVNWWMRRQKGGHT